MVEQKYDKPVMKMTELMKLGFPRSYLTKIYNTGNRNISWKTGPGKNDMILFDTGEFEKYRQKQMSVR